MSTGAVCVADVRTNYQQFGSKGSLKEAQEWKRKNVPDETDTW